MKTRITLVSNIIIQTVKKLCACGCGLETKINRDSKQYNIFLNGHWSRGKKNPLTEPDDYQSIAPDNSECGTNIAY